MAAMKLGENALYQPLYFKFFIAPASASLAKP